jgi:hypothetical protein
MARDPYIREKFTKERSAARTFAKDYLERAIRRIDIRRKSKAGARSNLTTSNSS